MVCIGPQYLYYTEVQERYDFGYTYQEVVCASPGEWLEQTLNVNVQDQQSLGSLSTRPVRALL